MNLHRWHDPVRYDAIKLALRLLNWQLIEGWIVEFGCYRGNLSQWMRQHSARPMLLFDTFFGFPDDPNDVRFRSTSVSLVAKKVNNMAEIYSGRFPDSAKGLDKRKIALAIIDFDKYEATKAAWKWVFPQLVRGAIVFVHNYQIWGAKRGTNDFLGERSRELILLPDRGGSAIWRRRNMGK